MRTNTMAGTIMGRIRGSKYIPSGTNSIEVPMARGKAEYKYHKNGDV